MVSLLSPGNSWMQKKQSTVSLYESIGFREKSMSRVPHMTGQSCFNTYILRGWNGFRKEYGVN